MTKTYALKRLLEHGAMRRAELIECTGWKPKQVYGTLTQLLSTGRVERCRVHAGKGYGNGYRAVGPA